MVSFLALATKCHAYKKTLNKYCSTTEWLNFILKKYGEDFLEEATFELGLEYSQWEVQFKMAH